MQPVEYDAEGTIRFKKNAIVRFLLDAGPHDMNFIALLPVSDDDRTQFAQLIGYSVSGAGDLPYFDRELLGRADEAAEKPLSGEHRG